LSRRRRSQPVAAIPTSTANPRRPFDSSCASVQLIERVGIPVALFAPSGETARWRTTGSAVDHLDVVKRRFRNRRRHTRCNARAQLHHPQRLEAHPDGGDDPRGCGPRRRSEIDELVDAGARRLEYTSADDRRKRDRRDARQAGQKWLPRLGDTACAATCAGESTTGTATDKTNPRNPGITRGADAIDARAPESAAQALSTTIRLEIHATAAINGSGARPRPGQCRQVVPMPSRSSGR